MLAIGSNGSTEFRAIDIRVIELSRIIDVLNVLYFISFPFYFSRLFRLHEIHSIQTVSEGCASHFNIFLDYSINLDQRKRPSYLQVFLFHLFDTKLTNSSQNWLTEFSKYVLPLLLPCPCPYPCSYFVPCCYPMYINLKSTDLQSYYVCPNSFFVTKNKLPPGLLIIVQRYEHTWLAVFKICCQ